MELIFFLLTAGVIWLPFAYNKLTTLQEVCRAAQANVQTQLARRFDLYLKATAVLEKGSDFERGVFNDVARLRSRTDIGLEQKVTELGRLIAVAESNPNVSAVGLFGTMQTVVNDTEASLQRARETVNFETGVYNITVRKFPMNVAAKILKFEPIVYFEHLM
jgi:LemA protein